MKQINQNKSWLGYAIAVGLLHLIGYLCASMAAGHDPAFWGLGLMAYMLGLRHAFDVDHIAAIDNTVRKLVQQQRNSNGVGFYFSLGHSSVVLLAVIATALSTQWMQRELPEMQEIGGMIGASVSGVFLLLIGIINLVILVRLLKLFRKERERPNQLEELLHSRGFLTKFIQPFFKFIQKSWHVYPLGFLFGLGFDTASEVSLLVLSAGASKEAVPFVGILSLPVLFAAGMSLLDTVDGMFMTTAYNWAFSTPLRKLYYNVTVTALAVSAALLVGAIELTQAIAGKLGLADGVWRWIRAIDLGAMGYLIVILCVLAWAVSYGVWKALRWEM